MVNVFPQATNVLLVPISTVYHANLTLPARMEGLGTPSILNVSARQTLSGMEIVVSLVEVDKFT